MQVEFLGHAGISIDSGKTKLLMDGWFSREGGFDASWYQLPANHHLGDNDWSKIDAVIVSHEHLDHLDSEFLQTLPASIPLYIPAYGSSLFARKLRRMTGRSPKVLSTGKEHQIGDLQLRIWTEASPMNQDSVWVFRHGDQSIVHTVDARLNPDQFDEILNYLDREPDLLLLQCSGASWFPLVYENYDEATKYARGMRKREQKLLYALSVANRLRPSTVACCAGPPAFLDESLLYANADPSFPPPAKPATGSRPKATGAVSKGLFQATDWIWPAANSPKIARCTMPLRGSIRRPISMSTPAVCNRTSPKCIVVPTLCAWAT